MRKVLFISRLSKFFRVNSAINFACVFMIAFVMGGCAGTKKETNIMQASSDMNKTVLASANVASEKSEISDDQTIVCRRIAPTGSRLKRKVCKTKALWALEAGSGNKAAEDLQKGVDRNRSIAVPSTDAMGGMSVGVPR